jgi:alkylation response protein AidB-like acyl-CoA dehydrogenase
MLRVRSSMFAGRALRHSAVIASARFAPATRCLSAQATSDPAWTEKWTAATSATNTADMTFDKSASRLRTLTQTNLLKATDIRDAPERFFEAHRILARHAVQDGPGFWIRFTVHYNLCAGTVLAVGSDEQVASLAKFQDEGKLGCFSLTEKLAGVQSGLVVQTTADWDVVRLLLRLYVCAACICGFEPCKYNIASSVLFSITARRLRKIT